VALAHQAKSDEAMRHWLEVLRLEPHHIDAHYNLGVALAKQQKLEEAIRHWLEVVRLDPDNTNALANLAVSYGRIARFGDAIVFAERAFNRASLTGDRALAQQMTERLRYYRQMSSPLLQNNLR
jgi:superkiller protein 3